MEVYLALALAGFVAVPINHQLVAPEIVNIAEHCQPSALIAQSKLIELKPQDLSGHLT
jgi:acyl-CoA synthetase (AMP-forming)/AMP-acid ligase II